MCFTHDQFEHGPSHMGQKLTQNQLVENFIRNFS